MKYRRAVWQRADSDSAVCGDTDLGSVDMALSVFAKGGGGTFSPGVCDCPYWGPRALDRNPKVSLHSSGVGVARWIGHLPLGRTVKGVQKAVGWILRHF